MPVTIEEFEALKKELANYQTYFNNLSAGMTRVQNAHDKTLKELADVKMELKKLKEPKQSIALVIEKSS